MKFNIDLNIVGFLECYGVSNAIANRSTEYRHEEIEFSRVSERKQFFFWLN